MNTFYQIMHKTCSESDALYNITNLSHSLESKIKFSNIMCNYEMKSPVINDNFYKFIMICHISTDYVKTVSKFQFIDSIRKNPFINSTAKEKIYNKFTDIQRKYTLFNRLCYRYKFNKSPISVQKDLFLNAIHSSRHNVMTILQNGQRYLFTTMDLKNIIESSLCNSPYHFSEPLPIKNPYNNMVFDKATLYNIYFFMKKSDCVLSTLFHQYFLSNFNLTKFRDANAVLIRDCHIDQFLKNASPEFLRFHILEMLASSDIACKYNIDSEFPKDKLIKIMRPYLEIYYKQQYTLDMNSQAYLKQLLDIKLNEFFLFNPKFGRKMIVRNKSNVHTVRFNDHHLQFKNINYDENYSKSHVELLPECAFDDSDENDENSDITDES